MQKIVILLIVLSQLAQAEVFCGDSVNSPTLIKASKPYAERNVKSQILKGLEADHNQYQAKLKLMNTAEALQAQAKEKFLNAKTKLTWQDWFGVRLIRAIFFLPTRTQYQQFQVAQKALNEANTALQNAKREFEKVKKLGTALIRANNPRVLQFLERTAGQLLKRAVITTEGQSISKVSIISIESTNLDFTYPLGLKALPMEKATLIAEISMGSTKIRLPIEIEFYPRTDRIIRMGIVELPTYSQSQQRPYNYVYAGYVFQPGLRSVSSHSHLQKYVEQNGLKVSIDKIRLIQRRAHQSRALKQQVETVLSAAQASKTSPTDDLMTSYFYYWAFSGHPFSMMFMPPTHWFLLNMTHSHDVQVATSKVIDQAVHGLNQGVEVTLTDVQNALRSAIPNIEEISPVQLRAPDVDAQTWERNINDMSLSGFTNDVQASIADRLQQSIDVETWRKASVELGIDPLASSPDEVGARDVPETVTETVDVEPAYESNDSGSGDTGGGNTD